MMRTLLLLSRNLSVAGLALLAAVRAVPELAGPAGYHPHGACYLWEPPLVWLHVSTDALIGLSYVAISATLGLLVYRNRREIPFDWMFLCFGVFIVSCGIVHLIEVSTVWVPAYWLSGGAKAVTAGVSVLTALLLPRVAALLESARLSDQRRADLITANAELERLNRRLSEMDRLKSDFFADISHELRTPLMLIVGPLRKLSESPPADPAELRRDLVTAERNTGLLLKHVNDLLEVSRLEAGAVALHRTRCDLSALLRLTAGHFESLAAQRGIALVLETPDGPLPADADADKIQRVLLNLVSNAFKYAPDRGRSGAGRRGRAAGWC
jgi:signal transduction histidine kinase